MTSRLLIEITQRHLEPARPAIARARALCRTLSDPQAAWQRLAAAGLVPDGQRLFRVRRGRTGDASRTVNTSSGRSPHPTTVLEHPPTREACVEFAGVQGLAEVERLAAEYRRRIEPFLFLVDRSSTPEIAVPVWRMLGSPTGPPECGPSICEVEGAWALATLVARLADAPLTEAAPVRFFAAQTHVEGFERFASARRPLPAVVSILGRSVPTPQPMIRARLQRFDNPFEPLVEIWRLGFGIRRITQKTTVLYLPHRGTPGGRRLIDEQVDRLHGEVRAARAAEVFQLLEAGVDPDRPDEEGRGALTHAVFAGHRAQQALIHGLLEAGADPLREDRNGRSPLALAIARDELSIVRRILSAGPLITAGRRTPLHLAAEHGSQRILEWLLSRGADVRTTTRCGWTPLHRASSAAGAQALLGAGADPNHRDGFGWTPLHHAAADNRIGVIQVLIEHGASAVPDRAGRTPREIATLASAVDLAATAPFGVTNPLPALPTWPRNPGLEAALAELGDQDDAWTVYADWLATHDEARAEIIHRAQAGEPTQSLAEAHRLALAGELQRHYPRWAADPLPQLRWGVLRTLELGDADPRTLLRSDALRFLRQLSMTGTLRHLEALAEASLPSLSALHLGPVVAVPPKMPRLAQLRTLRVRSAWALSIPMAWPGITEATLLDFPPVRAWDPTQLRLQLPDLRRLRLSRRDLREQPAMIALAAAPPEALTHLDLAMPPSLVSALLDQKLASCVAFLRLRVETDEMLDILHRKRPQLAKLRDLRLYGPGLARIDRAELRKRLAETIERVHLS